MFEEIFNNMAFPAACCIAMGAYVKYITDQHFKERKDLEESHSKAEDSIKEAIINNTIVMTKLCERMGNIESESGD